MKKYIIVIVLLIIALNGYSQLSNDGVDYQISSRHLSPEASQFMRYGNTPTRNFYGELDLSIPLYVYRDRDFEIPISLVYNNDGFKPNEHEGMIGLGWNLNIGGAITRKVEGGLQDEGSDALTQGVLSAAKSNFYKYDIPFNEKIRQGIICSRENNSNNIVNAPGNVSSHKHPSYSNYGELGPDLFNFNMPGHSGRFNFTWDGSIQIKGNQPYKVILDNYFSSDTNSKVTIISPDGYQYVFGGNSNSLETTSVLTPQTPFNPVKTIVSSWFLSKIIAPNKRTIEFIYKEKESKHNIIRKNVAQRKSIDVNQKNITQISEQGRIPKEDGYTFELISQTYLSKIIIDGDVTIDFLYKEKTKKFYEDADIDNLYRSYNTMNLALDQISISYGIKPIKKINFHQDFLGGNYTRFFLSKVSAGNEDYTFSYYNTDKIPIPDQSCIDHWGYYNGNNNTNNNGQNLLMPRMDIAYGNFNIFPYPYFEEYMVRKADEESSKVGMIKFMTYPTGGISNFYFETHKGLDYEVRKIQGQEETFVTRNEAGGPPPLGIAGGVRIKAIQDIDEDGNIYNRRDFLYPKGILTHYPHYLKEKASLSGWAYIECYILPTSRGNYPTDRHVQYAEVVEKTNAGSYIYKYSSYLDKENRDLYDSTIPHYVYNPQVSWYPFAEIMDIRGTDKSYRRGLLREKVILNNENDTVYKEVIKHNILQPSLSNYTNAIYHGETMTNKYTIENFAYLPTEKKQSTYFQNNLVTRTTQYEYNNKGVVSKETDVDNSIVIKYVYPYDKSVSPYTDMVSQNILSPVIEQETSRNSKRLSQKIREYSGFHNNKLYLPSKIYSVIGSSEKVLDAELKKYDEYGNLVQLTTKDNISNVYLWGYKGKYLLAEVNNTSYDDVKNALGGKLPESLSLEAGSDTTLIQSLHRSQYLKDAQISTVYHKPLIGATKMIDPQIISVNYEYDINNRLAKIKDNDMKTLTSYEYNLFPYPPIFIGFDVKDKYYVNDVSPFSVTKSGGTEQFACKWLIKKGNGEVLFQNDYSSSFYINHNFRHTDTGSAQITCFVKDANTGKIQTETRDFVIELEPFKYTIEVLDEYIFNSSKAFEAVVKRGSGDFSYDWSLKDISNSSNVVTILDKPNSGSKFQATFSRSGTIQLKCVIKDKVTGKTDTMVKDIMVKAFIPDIYISGPCAVGQLNIFYASVQGGSGNYTYSWLVKNADTNEVIYRSSVPSSSNSYTLTYAQPGKIEVSCTITDTSSGKTEERTELFDLIPPLIEFKNSTTVRDPQTRETTTTAVLDCFEEVTLEVEILGIFSSIYGKATFTVIKGNNTIYNKVLTRTVDDNTYLSEKVLITIPAGISTMKIQLSNYGGASLQAGMILHQVMSDTKMKIGSERRLMSGF